MKNIHGKFGALFLLLATLWAGGAQADTPNAEEFVTKAVIGNQFEISSSQTALQNSKNEAVRNFAQKMIDDHKTIGDQMKSTLASANMAMPVTENATDDRHSKMLSDLDKRTGADFDRDYAKMQVKAHKETVDLFQDYAKNGDNSALKTLASQTLPTLQQHEQLAKDLQASVQSAKHMKTSSR